ncbi:MAG: ATP-binding cassette domain-containing protein [Candidatus Kapaibacteriota bacterium]
MNRILLLANEVSKTYNGIDYVFRNLTFEISNNDVFGILGPNGSGKSTLLKLLANLIAPTEGSVFLKINDSILPASKQRDIQSFVAPYLTLFEEFKPMEFLEISFKIKGTRFDKSLAMELIEYFELTKALDKTIREFSSGMKQRMKYVLAFLQNPMLLFLDEPFTNLDESGIAKVMDFLIRFKAEGKIIVIATNDTREIELCNRRIILKRLSSDEPYFDSSV